MRVALSMCLCFAACHGAAPAKIDPPPDYLGVVSVASLDGAIGRLGAYANAISPGAGAALSSDGAMSVLATAVSARSLAGVATDKPLHVIILDPKKHPKPLLVLATVADEHKLKGGAGDVDVRVDGGRALIGPKAEVAEAAAWAFATLKDAPAATTLRLDLARVVERYRSDIDSARKQLQPLLSHSQGAGRILDAEIDILTRIAAQTRELTLTVDATPAEAELVIALAPNPGSGMEAFIKAQRPLSPALLAKLGPLDRAAYVLVGDYSLGPAREEMYALLSGFFGDVLGAAPDAAWKKRFNDWLDRFKGPVAGAMELGPGGVRFLQIAETDDAARTIAEAKALFPLAAPRTFEFGGMKITLSLTEGAIDEYVFKLGFETLPEKERELMRRMYGEEVHLALAPKDTLAYMAWGKDAGADAKALRDGTVGTAPLPPAVQAAVDSATARKSSYLVFMNIAKAMGALLGADAGGDDSGILLDLSFAGGDARMRVGVPAAHVRALMGAMRRR